MKKKTVLTVILLLFTNVITFAQDEGFSAPYNNTESSSSNLNGWLIFELIIILIVSILQIILFFKIWSMTNNVKSLKERFIDNEIPTSTNAITWKVMQLHLQGKDEEAYALLNETLYNSLTQNLSNIKIYNLRKDDDGCYYDYSGANMDIFFEKRKERKIKEAEVFYHKIGKEIPSYFQELTFTSFVQFRQEENISDEKSH